MLYGYTTFNMSMYRLKGHLGCFHILINLNNSAMTGEGNGNPLQYSCLENPVDRGAWWAAVHRVTQSQTRLKRLSSSRRVLVPHNPCLEKGMATHSSILAWRIPWTEEPGELQSIGSQGVGHDGSSLACACTHTHTHTHCPNWE